MSTTVSATAQPAQPEKLHVRDPATGELIGELAPTEPEQIGAVVQASAKVQPLWALLRVRDRGRYMQRMAQAVIDEFDELAHILSREQGRPRAEVAALELLPAIDALMWIAEEGAAVLEPRSVQSSRTLALARRARIAYEPYGVVAVIGAGSAPFAQPLRQIAGALLAGKGGPVQPPARAPPARGRVPPGAGRGRPPPGPLPALRRG